MDSLMYFTIVSTAYIGLVQVNIEDKGQLSIALVMINYFYLLIFVIKSFQLLFKLIRQSPKLAHVYMILTCSKKSLLESKK